MEGAFCVFADTIKIHLFGGGLVIFGNDALMFTVARASRKKEEKNNRDDSSHD